MTSIPPPQPSLHTHPEVPEGVVPAERPDEAPQRPLAAVPVWAILAALLVVFVVAAIAFALLAAVVEISGGEVTEEGPPGLLISATLVQDAALAAAAVGFAAIWARGLTPATFGLRTVPLGPAVGWSALAYAGFWVATAIFVAIVGEPEQQDLVRDLREQDALATLIGFAVLLTIAAPLAEEMFFRGFVFGVLREKVGTAVGVVVSGALFGVIHLPSSPLVSVGVLSIFGVLLCLLYLKTGSLLPCIALHAINNSIAFSATKSLPVAGAAVLVLGSTAISVAVAMWATRRATFPGVPRT
jgi:membrane protease YdiL (CAAX protease family)